ncbi:MAG: hypothetical protein QM743_08710 [Chitinophagaceae bacterium]
MKKPLLILMLSAATVRAEDPEDRKHCYIQVTTDFKTANYGYKSGCNVLRTVTDTAGRSFVSLNSLNEFPELFDSKTRITIYWLTTEAFPQDTTNGTF